jgi:hypothetical protein
VASCGNGSPAVIVLVCASITALLERNAGRKRVALLLLSVPSCLSRVRRQGIEREASTDNHRIPAMFDALHGARALSEPARMSQDTFWHMKNNSRDAARCWKIFDFIPVLFRIDYSVLTIFLHKLHAAFVLVTSCLRGRKKQSLMD